MSKNEELDLSKFPDNSETLRSHQLALLDKANKALKDKVGWVVDWYKEDARHSLQSRWDLGAQVAEIINDEDKENCKRYGKKAFATLAAFSGEAEGSLRLCARLATIFSANRIRELSEMVMADGITPLSFSHIRCVLSLDTEEARQTAINLALERCWTCDELSRYVLSLDKKKKGNNTQGRPVAKPKDLSGIIRQQMSFAEDFEKRNLQVWKTPDSSLSGHLAKVDEKEYTEELAEQLGQLAYKMKQLEIEAGDRAKEAESRFRQVRTALDLRYGSGLKLASQLTEEPDDDEDEDDDETPVESKKREKASV